MTSLQRSGYMQMDSHRQLMEIYKVKNLNLKHRQYSSSKLIKTIMLNETKSQNFIDKIGQTEAVSGTLDKKELKRYCITKLKSFNPQEKGVVKRKNSSLKLLKRDETIKYYNRSKMEGIKSKEFISNKDHDRASGSHSRETLSSQQTIPVKRRIQLLRMSNNRPKLQIKDENLAKKQPKLDVSFQEKLQKLHLDTSKVASNQQIRSQNVLGSGLKKCSSAKIKIFTKNPFEKYIKQKQALQEKHQASIQQIPEDFKQSRILEKIDESFPNVEQSAELQKLMEYV